MNTKKGIYHCFKCNASGRINDLKVGLDQFTSKVEKFLYGKGDSSPQTEAVPLSLPMGHKCVTPKSGLPYRYLINREMTDKEILTYKMRYCGEGPFKDRIIVPVYQDNELRYFVGRSYMKKSPKYMNAPVPKGGTIFSTFPGKVDKAIICEGIFDAVKIGKFFPAICILGKKLNGNEQIASIVKKTKEAFIMLDQDADHDAFSSYLVLNCYIPTRVGLFPKNKDPGSMTFAEIKDLLPPKGGLK